MMGMRNRWSPIVTRDIPQLAVITKIDVRAINFSIEPAAHNLKNPKNIKNTDEINQTQEIPLPTEPVTNLNPSAEVAISITGLILSQGFLAVVPFAIGPDHGDQK